MAYPRELVSLSIKVSDSPLHYSFLHFFSCVNLGVLPSSRRPGSRTFLQRGSPTPTSLASVARMPHYGTTRFENHPNEYLSLTAFSEWAPAALKGKKEEHCFWSS